MTRHLIKPTCRHGCRFLQIADELWLCPHAAYGRAAYYAGAIEDGRRLLERAGGYDLMLERVVSAEDEKREQRRQAKLEVLRRQAASVKYTNNA